jgi:hypothetical protein
VYYRLFNSIPGLYPLGALTSPTLSSHDKLNIFKDIETHWPRQQGLGLWEFKKGNQVLLVFIITI